MSNTTYTVTFQTPLSTSNYPVKDSTMAWEQTRAVRNFLQKIEAGTISANFACQTSALAPVQANNTLTLVYASISNGDTVVLAGHTLTAETGTPSGQDQFKKVTNLATTLANLNACINANTVLNKLMSSAITGTGVLTLTLFVPGVIGNQVPAVGSTGITVGAATFANGAGGMETAPVFYSRGA